MNAVDEISLFDSPPGDVGTDVFINVVMPIIRIASHHRTQEELVVMYGGFISAAFGSMAADFGQENAGIYMERFVAVLLKQAPLESGRPH